MTYRLIKLDSLMEMEFFSVEGNLSQINERDLHAILPKGMSTATLLEKVTAGEFVLATDFPATPLLIRPSKNLGASKWQINPDVESDFQASALTALTQRLNMMGQGGGSASADSVGSNRGNLHPAKELDYTPEPVLADSSAQAQHSTIAHEYNIEIAFSAKNPNHPIGLSTELFDTKHKIAKGNWTASPTTHGTKYTLKTDSNEPHHLNFRAAKNTMGLSLKNVTMVPLGSGKVNDAFIPIMPTVQFGERLGFATTGYLYHFKGNTLVQKYQWNGDETFSPMPDNIADYTFRHARMSLLVYWKIAGKVVKDQYLVYRAESLSAEEVNQVSPEWLEQHGVHLDIDALLKVTQTPQLERDNYEKESIKADITTHTVIEDPNTQQRETWVDIAKQYGLSAKELLNQNPSYNDNPLALKVGDILTMKQSVAEAPVVFERFECPPEAPSTYNNPHNSHYACEDTSITITNSAPILPLEKRKVKKGLPLVNVKPERILRIGVFFDGTGNNKTNDTYKEEFGDHSRTNIARLFEAYPEKTGESAKIYVSGVGTLDLDEKSPEERKAILDAGKDMLNNSLATGLYDDGGAFVKWQSLLRDLKNIIDDLNSTGVYQDITHIAFDVFGFSRGAALARHFVNAATKIGIPDYEDTREQNSPINLSNLVTPHLLGGEQHKEFNDDQSGYHADKTRSTSIRFVGLLDTVGSFYWPGNNKEGNFNLKLDPQCAKRVLHLIAHSEYRINFPLTTLKTNGKLPPNFYEEIFPGAHSDVGGGYPYKAMYMKNNLAKIFGVPTNSSYRLKLITVKDISNLQLTHEDMINAGLSTPNIELMRDAKVKAMSEQWNKESLQQYGVYSRITRDDKHLYYYHLLPIDSSLAGLTQERLKQQAELAGVKWLKQVNSELTSNKDYELNQDVKNIWKKLSNKPIGTIGTADWQPELSPISKEVVHVSHDFVIHIGFDTVKELEVNSIKNRNAFIQQTPEQITGTPERTHYENT